MSREDHNTPAERQQYMLQVRQQAFERAEDAKRRYRQERTGAEEAAYATRKRKNLVKSRYSQRFGYSLIALATIAIAVPLSQRTDLLKFVDAQHASWVMDKLETARDRVAGLFEDRLSVDDDLPEVVVAMQPPVQHGSFETATEPPPSPALENLIEPKAAMPGQDELNDLVVDTATIVDVPFIRSVSELGPKGKQGVADVAKALGAPRLIEVIGMADKAEDKALATVRSVSVVDALVRAGINPTIVRFSGVSFNVSAGGGEVTGARITAFAENAGPTIEPSTFESSPGTSTVVSPSAILPGVTLDKLDSQSRRPAFPLVPSPIPLQPSTGGVATAPSVRTSSSNLTQEQRASEPANAVDESLKEAIDAAASRIASQNRDTRAKAENSTKAGASSAGVDVQIRTDGLHSNGTRRGDAGTSGSETPAPSATLAAGPDASGSVGGGAGFSVVRVLEQGVLVRTGNMVQLIKIGKPLPDGKVLASTDSTTSTFGVR